MFRSFIPIVAFALRSRRLPLGSLLTMPNIRRFLSLPVVFAAAATTVSNSSSRQRPTSADISRIMLPDHANPAGNVHGGTILQMIDQAGFIAATRYCNQNNPSEPLVAALARLERCEFHEPMHIGEVAQVHAEVSFVAKHSLEVVVEVSALNPLTGKTRRTNTARAWYVAMPISCTAPAPRGSKKHFESAAIPPMAYASEEAEHAGQLRYGRQKNLRQSHEDVEAVVSDCKRVRNDLMRLHLGGENTKRASVADSASSLVQLMLPSDCSSNGVVQAGTIMKLMDNVAGIVAAKHCRKNVVTVSVDSMDFHTPVRNANVVSLYAWPTFTSSRSIEIEVAVFVESLESHEQTLCNNSHFTFVSLDDKGRVASVPQLVIASEDEKAAWTRGEARYTARKEERKKA